MDRQSLTRLRWRLRGAWQWPVFAACTVLDAVLLNQLPVAGDEGVGLVAGALLAGFLNLVVIAVLAPLGGRALRRRRNDLPREIAADYAGALLVPAVSAVLLAAGLLHRGTVQEQRDDLRAATAAAGAYMHSRAPAEFRPFAALLDTQRVDSDLYRACVPGEDGNRHLCVFVSTSQHPPGIRLDPNRIPNEEFQRLPARPR